jgi:CheY-like chemotaxis protein
MGRRRERRQGGFATPRSRAHGHPAAGARGYDATRQIKALPGLAAIPIIAVSSFAMKGDEEKAGASGCDDYVTKPYSPVDLLPLVRRYLEETAQR